MEMKVLVGCECSGVVRQAFRDLGHDAWSCDIQPADDASPYHLQCDVFEVLKENWQLAIFHPPCTHIAVSGAAWFKQKIADGRQQEGIDFFMRFTDLPNIPHVAIENPVCIMSRLWRKPDQIVNPWQFGHLEQKKTCLWLKGLPKLEETINVYEQMMKLPKNQRERLHYLPPGKDRAKARSKTFSGIAAAMATQWSNLPILSCRSQGELQ